MTLPKRCRCLSCCKRYVVDRGAVASEPTKDADSSNNNSTSSIHTTNSSSEMYFILRKLRIKKARSCKTVCQLLKTRYCSMCVVLSSFQSIHTLIRNNTYRTYYSIVHDEWWGGDGCLMVVSSARTSNGRLWVIQSGMSFMNKKEDLFVWITMISSFVSSSFCCCVFLHIKTKY